MILTKKQYDKLDKHLRSIGFKYYCQLCNSSVMKVDPEIYQLTGFNNGALVVKEWSYSPLIAITCMKCGQVTFINARVINILE